MKARSFLAASLTLLALAASTTACELVSGIHDIAATGGAGGAAGAGGTGPSSTGKGSASTGACTPETDAHFRNRFGHDCDALTDVDNCGDSRTADCGPCTTGDVCLSGACHTPVCLNLSFSSGATFGVASSQGQDMLAGVTPSGSTILVQEASPAAACTFYSLYVVDEIPPGSGGYQVKMVPAIANMATDVEGALAITADGLTIIGVDPTFTSLGVSTRSAIGATGFPPATPGDFAAITSTSNNPISGPAISGDGLAFYYTLGNDGIYESLRASTSDPFPAGTKMSADVQAFSYVTGVSSDRLALFLQNSSNGMGVLTRFSLDVPFTNPNAPNPAPSVPGFRTRPLADCRTLIGSCTQGVCGSENTCSFAGL